MPISISISNQLQLESYLNFVGVDNGVANGASDVPLVGVGDVLALLHGLGDTVGVANLVQKSPHAHPFEM